MAYSIRTKCQLDAIGLADNSNFEKQIYTKNKSWNKIILKYTGRNLNNLTPSQRQVLNLLKHNKHLTIKPTDKNLGPTVMETAVYTKQVLTEHLLTKDYKQLSVTEAKNILAKFKNTLQKLISNNQDLLTKAELIYFKR
jgi:hypothetical protein